MFRYTDYNLTLLGDSEIREKQIRVGIIEDPWSQSPLHTNCDIFTNSLNQYILRASCAPGTGNKTHLPLALMELRV